MAVWPVVRSTATCLLVLLFITSCVTQRNLEYMRESSGAIRTFKANEPADYKVKPNDELYIQIHSLDEDAANIFSYTRQQSYYLGSQGPYGASLLAYSVDSEGYLLLPLVGKIPVKDKTLSEITETIKDSLKNILNQPVVTVKLVNRFVSVLGEVRNPGHIPYSQEKLTVFDAIGFAGDMTEYADRNNVILVRNENGNNTRMELNLTRSEILGSAYYYMKPNDVLYVKPLRKRFWGLRHFPFEVILSAITTGLLIYNVVK